MGRRGPQPEPIEALRKRGSREGRDREKKPAKPRTRPALIEVEPIPIYDFAETTRLMPGYDPYHNADNFAFDDESAHDAVAFFHEKLKHVKGPKARTPFYLEKWQQGFVGNLFGWMNKSDGLRRYRSALVYVPRKNGKTPIVAGILLYCLFEDGEIGAEIYGAASEYKQASLVFEHARGMVVQNPDLSNQCKILAGQAKSIQLTDPEMLFSTYRVVSSDGGAAHGFNSSAYVVDELHTQKNGDLVEAMETSTAARAQPLGIYITTADFERESVCNEKHAYACKVRDGIIEDPSFLPVIYEVSREADWTDPAIWAEANPNLGVSVQIPYIEAACRKAQDSPAFENTFKRLHLDIKTEQISRWLAMDAWDACGEDADDPVVWRAQQMELLRGADCMGGLDLGSTSDLTALCLWFTQEDVDILLPFFWVPRGGVFKKDHKHRTLYEMWIRQGFIAVTGDTLQDTVTDYSEMRRDMRALADQFGIRELAVDRLFQGVQTCTDLAKDGFDVIAFGQGFYSMAAPTREFQERLMLGRIRHGMNPVLRWMASNAQVQHDPAGNMKVIKAQDGGGSLKVDGIVAAVMALGRASAPDESEGPSVYETRGILTL